MLNSLLNMTFFAQVIRISIPYILPTLGAVYSERGGVINIALEGMLLAGAFATTIGVFFTGSILLGITFGVFAGMSLALIHGVATVSLKVNQIITGIALNLLALGGTKFCSEYFFNSSSNSPRIAGVESLAIFENIQSPFLKELLNPFTLAIILLALLSHIVIFKTSYGLRLRAVGENPETAATLGISVTKTRYAGLLMSGFFSGLGGAWLALDQHSFTDGMSAGRGFIALAALIIGKWKPIPAVTACLFFGCAESVANHLQGEAIPSQFIQMIPYVLTMVVLAGFIGRSTPPAADGIPYEQEQSQ